MPKFTNKENVHPKLQEVQKRVPPASVVNALATRPQAVLVYSRPTVPIAPTGAMVPNLQATRFPSSATIQPVLQAPNALALPMIAAGTVGNDAPNVKVEAPSQGNCLGAFCLTCNPQTEVVPVEAAPQPMEPQVATNAAIQYPYALQPALPPPQHQALPPHALQYPPPLQMQPPLQVQHQAYHPHPVSGVQGPILVYSRDAYLQAHRQANQLPTVPVEHIAPLQAEPKPLLTLQALNLFSTPAGIWPTTIITRPEYGLYEKIKAHPTAKLILRHFQICQAPIGLVTGTRRQEGFYWVILLLPDMGNEEIKRKKVEHLVEISTPLEQCAWVLDPCAPGRGGEFLRFLDPEKLMKWRRLILRPRIDAAGEAMMDLEKFIWRLENWDPEWRSVICCSVAEIQGIRSLALGTGQWATAVYQHAYGARLSDVSPTINQARSMMGAALESIGSRELRLPFLHPARQGYAGGLAK